MPLITSKAASSQPFSALSAFAGAMSALGQNAATPITGWAKVTSFGSDIAVDAGHNQINLLTVGLYVIQGVAAFTFAHSSTEILCVINGSSLWNSEAIPAYFGSPSVGNGVTSHGSAFAWVLTTDTSASVTFAAGPCGGTLAEDLLFAEIEVARIG